MKIEPAVVIAWLLRYTESKETRAALNNLNYDNDIANDVAFLLDTMNLLNLSKETVNLDEKLMLAAVNLTKNPYRRIQLAQIYVPLFNYFGFNKPIGEHLVQYEVKFYNGEEVMAKYNVPPGPLLGQMIRQFQTDDYLLSLSGQG
jgi:hypothetical protein